MPALLRPATPDDASRLAFIHVRSWRETYAGLMPDTCLDRMTDEAMRQHRERQWTGLLQAEGDVVQVAEVDGQVLGFVSGGAARPHPVLASGYDAEVYALYTLRAAHGQGLGRLLMAAAASELQRRGFRGLALWVLGSNPTLGFYRHLGGRELGQKVELVLGGELVEVALGWPRLDVLF